MVKNRQRATPGPSTPQGEAVAVWALWGVLLVAMGVTYARLSPAELYHVSGRGLAGGLSRVVVQLNFPVALVAIALVLVAASALPARAWWIGAPAVVLCAVTVWPGVVDDGDLDVRWVNLLPATGVALAFGLTMAAVRVGGARVSERRPFDPVRLVAVAAVLLVSVPWIAADLGLVAPGVVGADVHLGHHHGVDGTLLVVTALVLSRTRIDPPRLRRAVGGYLALMLGYGLINLVQDGWNEQVVKRGWAEWQVPSALKPSVTPVWLVVLAVAVVVGLVLRHETEHTAPRTPG
jgi:hypothetical protein